MTSQKRGLGRGLSALIPTTQPEEKLRLEDLPLESIAPNPNQPRKHFDPATLEELVASVKEFGLVQPVIVRPRDEGYEMVAGERRWRAAQEAGLKTIPAIVKSSSDVDSLEIALIENLQREDLNALEEAAAYQQLIEQFNITHTELASRLGKGRATISNTLRLLHLPIVIQKEIIEGNLSSGHARALLAIPDMDRQRRLAERIISDGISVRQTENIIRFMLSERQGSRRRPRQSKTFRSLAKILAEYLSSPVTVKTAGEGGKIEIEFSSLDDLEKIFKLITEKTKGEQVGQA